MFSKKTPIGKLSVFYVEINIDAIVSFLENKEVIQPTEKSAWSKDSKTKKYEITFLGTDPFVFYHNSANQFSASFSGLDTFNNQGQVIEWEWADHLFIVKAEDEIIFCISDADIRYLLLNGEAHSNSLKKDMEGYVVDGELEFDYVKSIYKSLIYGDGLSYSNQLVSLCALHCRFRDVVHYDQAKV